MKATFAAILNKVETRVDGSVKLVFETREFSNPDHTAALFSLARKEGWLLFSANELNESDIPKERAKIEGSKTQCQRMRSVLFVLYNKIKKNNALNVDFEEFYKIRTESFIENIKEEIELL